MSAPGTDVPTDAPPTHNVLRDDEHLRNDQYLSHPPRTYIGPGASFCCALALRIVILILSIVALVLCIVTQATPFFEEVEPSGKKQKTTEYYLWYRIKKQSPGKKPKKDDRDDDMNGISTCLIIGLVLSIFSLALSIAYLALLCTHRSQRNRDDVGAQRRHQVRLQKFEDEDTEMRDLAAGDAHQSTAQRRGALLEGLRRDAHGDGVGLYERERKRRRADRGVWFGVFFALLVTFVLVLVGFIVAVVVFNEEYKIDEEDKYPGGDTSSLREGVWIALAAAIIALIAFILTALRPCGRGHLEDLVRPDSYRAGQYAPPAASSRDNFAPYPGADDDASPTVPPKSQRIATGVPLQPGTTHPGDGLHSPPVAENYATYHPQYGRGYYYDNEAGQTANNRVHGVDPAEK